MEQRQGVTEFEFDGGEEVDNGEEAEEAGEAEGAEEEDGDDAANNDEPQTVFDFYGGSREEDDGQRPSRAEETIDRLMNERENRSPTAAW